MGLFSKKSAPPPASGPRVFDGIKGNERLFSLVKTFLERAGQGWTDPIADAAGDIFQAMPIDDPHAKVGSDFFDARWAWIFAVAQRAEKDGKFYDAGRIGLMTEIWNRGILREEPRYEMGRLTRVPANLEQDIYRIALRSLARIDGAAVLIRGGESGWTVNEALNQLSHTIQILPDSGVKVAPDLLAMAGGESAALGVAPVQAQPMNMGGQIDHVEFSQKVLDDVTANRQEADRGDEASAAYLRGSAITFNQGDPREAIVEFERAAQLGHAGAMYEAGCLLNELGDSARAAYHWRGAADAGNANAAWNLAVAFLNSGDRDGARPWYQRAGELGESQGYGALTQMARDDGDSAALLHWSRLGAEAGEQFCMFFFGAGVMQDNNRTPAQLRDAVHFLEQAAEMGDPDSMFMAGLANDASGNSFAANRWLRSAADLGHERAGQLLAGGGF